MLRAAAASAACETSGPLIDKSRGAEQSRHAK